MEGLGSEVPNDEVSMQKASSLLLLSLLLEVTPGQWPASSELQVCDFSQPVPAIAQHSALKLFLNFVSNSLAISVPLMANATVGGQDFPPVQRYLETL